MSSSEVITIAVAGTTERTLSCIDALVADQKFQIKYCITPEPKPIGRKQISTANPVHQWAQDHQTPVFLVQKSLSKELKEPLLQAPQVDYLLVVDFGYLVPQWLLELPRQAPLNIHPSLLPAWRGSSPAQFSLLYADTNSAVTLMIMNEKLDQGPLLFQIPFEVKPSWDSTAYYHRSFQLICNELPKLIKKHAQGHLSAQDQPLLSPTPLARQLSKEDGFVEWYTLKTALNNPEFIGKPSSFSSPLLHELKTHQPTTPLAAVIERASRALAPWPYLWTMVPTKDGDKRMKIISTKWNTLTQQLELDQVVLDGKKQQPWGDISHIVQ